MKSYLLLLLFVVLSNQTVASTRIAILNFELNDLTLAPNIPSEVERTASVKAQLEETLQSANYEIVYISAKDQTQANAGFGYLFEHHDAAAELAKKAKAEYVLVGRLHKPSFLFAYLIGHLIRVDTGQLIGNYVTESKGGDKKLLHKAIESLTVKIDHDLDNHYQPPAPKR